MSGGIDSPNAHQMAGKGGEKTTAERVASTRNALAHAAPRPEVIAATESLLARSDACRYRRPYHELVVRGREPGAVADYTVAERYLLRTAATGQRSPLRNISSTEG